jgi:hypothetical protein
VFLLLLIFLILKSADMALSSIKITDLPNEVSKDSNITRSSIVIYQSIAFD